MLSKKVYIPVSILALAAAYWNVVVYQKKSELAHFCEPFLVACQSQSGCIVAPNGWRVSADGSYHLNFMEYQATQIDFKLSWHIATDVYLVAIGGKNMPLSIERVVE